MRKISFPLGFGPRTAQPVAIRYTDRAIPAHVTCLDLPYFSTLSHKQHDFRNNITKQKICMFICSTNLSDIFRILRRIQLDVIINVHRLSDKVPVILVRVQIDLNVFVYFRKIPRYQIAFIASSWSRVVACGRQTDWQTDMLKIIVAFHNS